MRIKEVCVLTCLFICVLLFSSCQSSENLQLTATPIEQTEEIVVLTDTPAPTSSAPPGEEQILTNLTAFAKLYGYIRYFHPSDQAVSLRWNRAVSNGIAAVMNAHNPEELAAALQAFFEPAAPTLRVFPVGERPDVPEELEIPEDAADLQVVMWRHYGGADAVGESLYHRDVISAAVVDGQIPEGFNDPRDPYYAEIGGGVAVLVPTALFADADGTFPHVDTAMADLPDWDYTDDPSIQQLSIGVIVWNIYKHFYPLLDFANVDMEVVLEGTLSRLMDATSEEEFLAALRWQAAQIDDGHTRVTPMNFNFEYTPRVMLDWVEDSLVVIAAYGDVARYLSPGDIILSIDGEPAADCVARKLELVSSATDAYRYWIVSRDILMGIEGTTVDLVVLTPEGDQIEVTLERNNFARYTPYSPYGDPYPTQLSEVDPGILFVNLTSFSLEDLEAAIPQLQEAQGIIFDLRGYPNWDTMTALIGHLIDETVSSAPYSVPIYTMPDQQQVSYDPLDFQIEPVLPRLEAKIVFLTNERALCAPETFLQIIAEHGLAEIVGEPTGGSSGENSMLRLNTPYGEYIFNWSGMVVFNYDGSRLHGVGVQPTVYAAPTLQGIAEGRDELLEIAIEVINQEE